MNPINPAPSNFSRLFPNTGVLAYYDPFSQIINLCKYNQADYLAIDPYGPKPSEIELLTLAEHELTHWLDHISTLWGQKNLVLLFNALNARANENIDHFWRIKEYSTDVARNTFSDYYSEQYNLHQGEIKTPWRFSITSGIRFNTDGKPNHDRPILFVGFKCYDNIPVARVPVSIESILECNAMYAEYYMKVGLYSLIENVVEKKIRLNKTSQDLFTSLYHRDLVRYSVIAHLTANLNSQSDAAWAYQIASSIGTVTLNLPDSVYDGIKLNDMGDGEWKRRCRELINIKDRGFTFFNITKNQVEEHGKKSYTLDKLLSSSYLPNRTEMEQEVVHCMENGLKGLIDGPFKNAARKTINMGIEIFRQRGLDGKNKGLREFIHSKNYLPNIIFGDTLFTGANFDVENSLDDLKNGKDLIIEDRYLLHDYYARKFNEFVSACGI